jgi:hypothetical protein
LAGLPKMQGTQVEPGTSQFRRPWGNERCEENQHEYDEARS